jgi:co-chaperonin GroES (HSP10)
MKIMNLGVAIKPKNMEVKQQGLIVIPETAHLSAKYKEGIVVGVGNGTEERPMEVEVGDMLMYKKAVYPVTEGCDIVSIEDVLYVTGRKCAISGCLEAAMPGSKYCATHFSDLLEE